MSRRRVRRELAEALEHAGFWAGLDPDERRRRRTGLAAGRVPLLEEAFDRGWRADGEDLAEGEVEDLLSNVTIGLRRFGVEPDITTIESPWAPRSQGYSIAIDGETIDLYRFAERGQPAAEDAWTDCTVKPLAALNRLMADTGHRLVVFHPGANDGVVMVLPLAAIEVLTTHPGVPEEDRPIVP